MKTAEALKIAGSLSNPSKMPCKGYSLPARHCKTGSKLRKVEGSVCSDCYACKGCYQFPGVKACLENRYKAIRRQKWIDAMVALIQGSTKTKKFFRWHDSGDIQNVGHLAQIVEVARRLPEVSFWLPTKERAILAQFKGSLPSNLVVRLSASMVDQRVKFDGLTSTVHEVRGPRGFECPAPKTGGSCGSCRACWNPDIKNISYLKH